MSDAGMLVFQPLAHSTYSPTHLPTHPLTMLTNHLHLLTYPPIHWQCKLPTSTYSISVPLSTSSSLQSLHYYSSIHPPNHHKINPTTHPPPKFAPPPTIQTPSPPSLPPARAAFIVTDHPNPSLISESFVASCIRVEILSPAYKSRY